MVTMFAKRLVSFVKSMDGLSSNLLIGLARPESRLRCTKPGNVNQISIR